MCGIYSIVSKENIIFDLVSGLQKLEYRGYDSSGIATLIKGGLKSYKAEGKIKNLVKLINKEDISSHVAIAHTRWATHGKANRENAHPHKSKNFAVVHNGIIENFREIKEWLIKRGHVFQSETDTEVIPHLIEEYYQEKKGDIEEAIRRALNRLKGSYAISIMSNFFANKIFVAKKGSPLVIGIAKDAHFIASDVYAMPNFVHNICYLEDDDIAVVQANKFVIYDKENKESERESAPLTISNIISGKAGFRHFMEKEIHEQPEVITNILNTYCNRENNDIFFPNANINFASLNKVVFIACGSSYFSALISKYYLENYAKIDCKLEIASEFLYNDYIAKADLYIFISQSGETADSVKSLQKVKEVGGKSLVITNVEHSSMARYGDSFINLLAGPEIGVASTKAFTAQLSILLLISIEAAAQKNLMNKIEKRDLCRSLRSLPNLMVDSIAKQKQVIKVAKLLKNVSNIIYLGRGPSHGLAYEAALKLKELSYIHAEAIASGELKHGSDSFSR